MTDTPLVSILMTSYNREKYIGDAISSVLASTYPHFELIIVDDGSKDNTVNIARSFAAKDNRVFVYENEQNLGDYPNRNKAASYAKGKYLKYVDADDLIYPRGLEILVRSMEKYPDVRWGLCSLFQDNDRMFPFVLGPQDAYKYHYCGPGLFHKAPLSSIIRKDLFIEVGGFKSIRMAGDSEMWHRLGQKNPVVLMQRGIVWYRIHNEQEMLLYDKFKHVYREIMTGFLKDPECPLDRNTVEQVFKKQRKITMRTALKSLASLKFGLFSEEMNYYKNLSL